MMERLYSNALFISSICILYSVTVLVVLYNLILILFLHFASLSFFYMLLLLEGQLAAKTCIVTIISKCMLSMLSKDCAIGDTYV